MNQELFFAHIRSEPFPGRLNQSQIEGVNLIIDEARRRRWDDRWTAYALATVFHETAASMAPICEFGKGKGRAYGKADPETAQTYFGRGFVQLTWKENYQSMSQITGKDLVKYPDLALRPDIAMQILFEGMERGSFTGKRLDQYFSSRTDWIGARQIVNGKDRAHHIAQVAKQFYAAMQVSQQSATILVKEVEANAQTAKSLLKSKTAWGAICAGCAAVSAAVREFVGVAGNASGSANGIFVGVAIIGILGALIVISERKRRGRQFGY